MRLPFASWLDPVDAMGSFFVPLALIFACAFYALRFRWVRRRARRAQDAGYLPTYTSLGNAFQELQKLTLPRYEFVLRQKLNGDTEEDESGGPEKAGQK